MAMIKIGTPYPGPGVTIERFGKQDMVVPYTIDGEGPFQVRVPMEDYNPSTAENAVRTQAQSQTALKGKEFTL